ncbi:hypothetical protein Cst04h_12950 [Corynebacterium striatum]|uniref:Uncharacterized protein n=1 Tax=Corynebacterium striatum TaxID=43770 RepID=A0ABC9ZMH8_CORST|nr:hypothetical protein Cst04h_12950 [Corynebacterium striatum]
MTQHQRIVVPPTSTMKENPLAVPGTWNPGTNYADSRYQLPQINTRFWTRIVEDELVWFR